MSVDRSHCIWAVRHIIVRYHDHFRSCGVGLAMGYAAIVVFVYDWVSSRPGCSQVPRIVNVGVGYLVLVFVLSVFLYLDVTPTV